jgi:hypothetical protein
MKHFDTLKVTLVGSGGFGALMTNIDLVFKVLIGGATLIYLGIKIYKELNK